MDELTTNIPFGFPKEDCNILVKLNDGSMIIPLDFLSSVSKCFEKKLERHHKGPHQKYSLDMTSFNYKSLEQAFSFFCPSHTIPLSAGMLSLFAYFGIKQDHKKVMEN